MTPQERDDLRIAYAGAILAAMQNREHVHPVTPNQRAIADVARRERIIHSCDEADALIRELETRMEVQRFPDGMPIDPRALDPAQRFCSHGVSMADECKLCAAGEPSPPAWQRDNEVTRDVLELASVEVPAETIATWSDAECMAAEEWAGAVHLKASDNDDVVVPPTPAHVAPYVGNR